MSANWKKVLIDILKYAVGAIIGAVGVTASGCACVPQFFF